MGTLACHSQPVVSTDSSLCPTSPRPEDGDYLVDVLRSKTGTTETELIEKLVAEAANLGIDTAQPLANAEKSVTSSLDFLLHSFSSDAQTCANSTACTLSQCPSSAPDSPSLTDISGTLSPRRWSEALDFDVYEKYLSYLGPNITQPKYARTSDSEAADTLRVKRGPFSKKTGISNLKLGIKSRISWKKRAANSSRKTT